jgi:hypothetical protein
VKRLLGYLLFGLVAFAVSLLLQVPASALTDLVAHRLPGFSVDSVQGSALSGTAQGVRFQQVRLHNVTWRLRFWPLLLGRLEFGVTISEPELQLTGVVGTALDRELRVTALTGQLPLPRAIQLAGRPPPPLNGRLELDQLELGLDPRGHPRRAHGRVHLRDAHTSFGRRLALGDFSIELDTREATIQAAVKDNGGPLSLTGNLTLAPDGRYRFSGQAAVRDGADRDLLQALGLLGRPGSDGKWNLTFDGTLPS